MGAVVNTATDSAVVSLVSTFGDLPLGEAAALPVHMTSLNATATRTDAPISWSTATETNCAGFEIERRAITDQQSSITNVAEAGRCYRASFDGAVVPSFPAPPFC